MSHNIVGSVGFEAQEFDNTYVLNLSETIYCTLCRERKKAAAQLHVTQRCIGLSRLFVRLSGFGILLAFKTEEEMGGGDDLE